MSEGAFWNATEEFVADAVSFIPADCVESILKEAYKTAFLFDVPNNILLCFHMNEARGSELSHVRMQLADALEYWLGQIVAPEDRPAAEEFFRRILSGDAESERAELEFRAPARAGEQRYYRGSLYPLGDGKHLFCCRDLSAVRQLRTLEERCRELEERCRELEEAAAADRALRAAFERSGLVLLDWDGASGRLDASPGFQRYAASRVQPGLLGRNAQEWSGIHPEDVPRFLALGRDGGKTLSEATVRVMTVDEGYRWTDVTALPRRDGQDRLAGIGYLLRDVDELVRTKAALSRSEQRFSRVINNLMEGVVIFELDKHRQHMHIKYVSDTALRFYGVRQKEYRERSDAGETLDEILGTPLLSPEELETLTERGKVTFTRSFFDFPARQRFFEAICSVDRSGEPDTYYAIIHETTAEQEARAQSRWQQEKYRLICQDSDIITFDYKVAVDELTYSLNLPPDGYREEVVPAFLADIEMSTIFREAQLQAFRSYMSAALRGENVEEFEILLNLHRRGFEWYSTKLFGVRDESGGVYRVIGRTQSIQKMKERQMKRLRSEAVVQVALSSDALFSAAFSVADGERVGITGEVIPEEFRQLVRLSQLFEYLQKITHPEDLELLLSNTLGSYFPASDDTSRKRKFECRLRSDRPGPDAYRWVQITYMHTFGEMVDSPLLYIFIMDIDEEKRKLLQITEQASVDATTKFLNRAAFERLYERECALAAGSESLNALLLLELAAEGGAQGYESLRQGEEAARRLADTVRLWARKDDVAARFSDARFLICMHDVENKVILRERVQSLSRALNHRAQERGGERVYLGATRCFREREGDFMSAYNQAELALLTAKGSGEREAVFYTDTLGQRLGAPDRHRVQIRTFGYFEVFVDHRPIVFKSAKAKELLAVLIDRRGGLLSTDEAISYLWEEEPADKVTRSRYRKVAMRLKETLEEYGVEEIVEVSDRRRRIVTEKVQCDLFDFVSGKPEFSNLYSGSYLLNYSWAEVTTSQLNREYWSL